MVEPWDIVVTDIEGDGLYYDVTVAHCAVIIDVLTGEALEYGPDQIGEYLKKLHECKLMCGHNVLDYDFPSLFKLYGFTTTVEHVCDTLVLSRLIYPERNGGHSLASWGKSLGEPKTDWRAEAESLGLCRPNDPRGAEFKVYHPRMLAYCTQDGRVNLKMLREVLKYMGWTLDELLEYSKEVQLYNG